MKWYELDWLLPYRDLLLAAGYGLVVAGAAIVYFPAGLVVAGAGLVALSWKMAKV